MEDDAINVQQQKGEISESMVNTNQEKEEINLPKGQEINRESNDDLENQQEDETEKKEVSTGVAPTEANNIEEIQLSTEEMPTEENITTTLPKVELDTAAREETSYEIEVDLAREGPKDSAISSLLKEAKINQILDMKNKLSSLISNIRNTRTFCEKYDNENQYLQDYIGSLMKSGELK